MGRPIEARAAIAEARKDDPNAAGSYVAEGLLADRKQPGEAKAAYAKAAELGATSAYRGYSARTVDVSAQPFDETSMPNREGPDESRRGEHALADAYAWLGETKVQSSAPTSPSASSAGQSRSSRSKRGIACAPGK